MPDEVLIDSYTDYSFNMVKKDLHPSDSSYYSATSQSFETPASPIYKITSAKFYLLKSGSPTGNAYVVLYAHSGTYGTSSVPTGRPLATSDAFDVSTLTTSIQFIPFTFTGSQQYIMEPSTQYCIAFENPRTGTIDTSNYVLSGGKMTTPTHGGNEADYLNGAWTAYADEDKTFYLYGKQIVVLPLCKSAFRGLKAGRNASFDVTKRKLVLGDANATTGWYAESYTESTIKMIIADRATNPVNLPVGVYVRLDAVGVTNDLFIKQDDQIQTYGSVDYVVKATKNHWRGDRFAFTECDLQELKMYKEG